MKQQSSTVSRRRFLAGTTAGVVGIGALHSSPVKADHAQSSTASSTEWSQYAFDSGRSGGATGRQAPIKNFTPKWSINRQNAGQPVADKDTVYIVTTSLTGDNPQLNAVARTDGSLRWQTSLTSTYRSVTDREVPPVLVDGTVYHSNMAHTCAFDAETGAEQWRSPNGGSWLVVSDGYLYLNGDNGNFVTLDATDGSVVWDGIQRGDSAFLTSRHAVADGTLYVGTKKRRGNTSSEVIALDSTTGSSRWSTKLNTNHPEITATTKNTLVVTDTTMYSLNPVSGEIRWKKHGGPLERGEGRIVSSPVLNGNIVYVTIDGTLHALDVRTGEGIWTADGMGKITLVGEHLYGVLGSDLAVLDAVSGRKLTDYYYPGDGTFDAQTLVPLDDMILVGLYQYFGDQVVPISGRPLLALAGDE